MLTLDEALTIAERHPRPAAPSLGLRLFADGAIESRCGWFIPWFSEEPCGGSTGLIVHKESGRVFRCGSAYSPAQDLAWFDQGYQFMVADLEVQSVLDERAAVTGLKKLRLTVVEPTFEHGQWWRIPRRLTGRELSARLAQLPCVFPSLVLYFRRRELDALRESKALTFTLVEREIEPSAP